MKPKVYPSPFLALLCISIVYSDARIEIEKDIVLKKGNDWNGWITHKAQHKRRKLV
jgi:hypothetical protein